MKSNSLTAFAFSFALLGAANSFGQAQAVTDPVGFITLNIAGGGTPSSPKLSLISSTLVRPILYQGLITDITGTTITVSSSPAAPWATGAFNGANGSHYVEIISTAVPARTGTMADIASTPTTNSIVTVGDLSINQAAVGDTIRIRRDLTIGELFGATNSAGLLASDDPTSADEVLIYSAAASESYFYFTGAEGFPAGWYDSGFNLAPGVAQNVSIAPNQAVVVKRKAAGALTITSVGSVKTGNTLFPVVNGLNVLGTVSAKGLTLATSGLRTANDTTGVKPSDDPATADEVIIYDGSGSTSYFYFTGAEGFPAGWYDSGFNLAPGVADAVIIAPGSAFVVNRKGGPSFNWVLPSPQSF